MLFFKRNVTLLAYHLVQIIWRSKVTRLDSLQAKNYTTILKCNPRSCKSSGLSRRNGRRSGDLAPPAAILEMLNSLTSRKRVTRESASITALSSCKKVRERETKIVYECPAYSRIKETIANAENVAYNSFNKELRYFSKFFSLYHLKRAMVAPTN